MDSAVNRGQAESEALDRATIACREFYAEFDGFAENPSGFGRVTILTLDGWRDNCLRRWGFDDPFDDLKNRENEKMLPLLPSVCRRSIRWPAASNWMR